MRKKHTDFKVGSLVKLNEAICDAQYSLVIKKKDPDSLAADKCSWKYMSLGFLASIGPEQLEKDLVGIVLDNFAKSKSIVRNLIVLMDNFIYAISYDSLELI